MPYKNGDPKKKKSSGSSSGAADLNKTTAKQKKVRGSCEDGNLMACKTKVAKTPKFSATSKQSSLGLVKSKPKKEQKPTREQKQRAKNNRPSNPRFL
jgi:hypothetical protein